MPKVKVLQISEGTSVSSATDLTLTTVSAKSADYTLLTTDNIDVILMTTGASTKTVTLAAAASSTGRKLTVKKVDSGAGTVVLDGNASETIDGQPTAVITTQYSFMQIVCDGSNWHIIA